MALELFSESGESVFFMKDADIGRDPGSNHLVIADKMVSAKHARIEFRDDAWTLRDLNSRNGTSVNGRRIDDRTRLQPGDTIRFADGEPWAVEIAQTPSQPIGPGGTEGRIPLPILFHLHLSWDGPDKGIIRVEFNGTTHEKRAGQPFVLLELLARQPARWVDDHDLKRGLWGPTPVGRVTLNVLVHNTRKLFTGWGLDCACIEKEDGRTRLLLPPERVHRG